MKLLKLLILSFCVSNLSAQKLFVRFENDTKFCIAYSVVCKNGGGIHGIMSARYNTEHILPGEVKKVEVKIAADSKGGTILHPFCSYIPCSKPVCPSGSYVYVFTIKNYGSYLHIQEPCD